MSRKEIVLLVSRAFAAIQLVSALIEMSVLPSRLFSLYRHAGFIGVPTSLPSSYAITYDRIDILFLFARIAGLLILTAVFWKCGPWVERVVFSEQDVSGRTAAD
jgi:hypothetical protein